MKRLGALLVVAACSVASEDRSFDAPSPDDFRYVSDMLAKRCGSLDCHGQVGRALRLYGRFGLRLDPTHIPGGHMDTQEEVDANYASVLTLEPEILSAVRRDRGGEAERLTLVRKARGQLGHKGGVALDAPGTLCFSSWLAGEVDKKTCFQSAELPKPAGFSHGSGGSGGTISGGAGGSGGTISGGAGGNVTGGTGGTPSGGSGGTTTGGTTGTGGEAGCGGAGGSCIDFWTDFYDPKCVAKPTPVDHLAYAHTDCQPCHGPTGSATQFFIAGMIWDWGAKKGAAKIEVGLRDDKTFVYTCTDSAGFFSVPAAGSPAVNWLTVETRMRGELGEKTMPAEKEHKPGCNDTKCHGHAEHQLWAP